MAADGTVGAQPTDRNQLTKDCKLTVNVVKRIAALLKAANAPKINGHYVCILHPYAAYDLTNDPKWEDMHKYCKPEEMYEGEIGRIAGVRFVESSEAAVYTGEENDCLQSQPLRWTFLLPILRLTVVAIPFLSRPQLLGRQRC